MSKRKHAKKKRFHDRGPEGSLKEVLSLYVKLADLKKEVAQAGEKEERIEDRLADLEVHVGLLIRLLTTLCLEKLGIRAEALKRLVRRIEKEALRDSQIMELESLYRLSGVSSKKSSSLRARPKNDPWEQIS